MLGDGVAYATKHLNPTVLFDMATLTGAQGVGVWPPFVSLLLLLALLARLLRLLLLPLLFHSLSLFAVVRARACARVCTCAVQASPLAGSTPPSTATTTSWRRWCWRPASGLGTWCPRYAPMGPAL